jgi:hypothetical protein
MAAGVLDLLLSVPLLAPLEDFFAAFASSANFSLSFLERCFVGWCLIVLGPAAAAASCAAFALARMEAKPPFLG